MNSQNGTLKSMAELAMVRNDSNARVVDVPYTATKGTIFYRRRTPMAEMLEVLALIAEGARISSLARVKGHKEDTILNWLEEAGNHVASIEAILLANYQLKRGQLDALWPYVGNKGEKKPIRKLTQAAGYGSLYSAV